MVRIGDANKRVLDLVLASTALVVASPLMLCLAMMIVIDGRGGILFRCSRVGRNGRTMSMLKLRKMKRGASGVASRPRTMSASRGPVASWRGRSSTRYRSCGTSSKET